MMVVRAFVCRDIPRQGMTPRPVSTRVPQRSSALGNVLEDGLKIRDGVGPGFV